MLVLHNSSVWFKLFQSYGEKEIVAYYRLMNGIKLDEALIIFEHYCPAYQPFLNPTFELEIEVL